MTFLGFDPGQVREAASELLELDAAWLREGEKFETKK